MAARSRYHHGNLRGALIAAGLALTRASGPAALSIREATRRAGVSPTATYRHFADRRALLDAVSRAIQERLAARMRDIEPSGDPEPDASARARDRLRAVGMGYIEFALAEPGWFRVVFFPDPPSEPAGGEVGGGEVGGGGAAPPFQALVDALDALAAAGLLSRRQRRDAEWACWSAVHGFAELALRGPLRDRPRNELHRLATATVDAIIAGLAR